MTMHLIRQKGRYLENAIFEKSYSGLTLKSWFKIIVKGQRFQPQQSMEGIEIFIIRISNASTINHFAE